LITIWPLACNLRNSTNHTYSHIADSTLKDVMTITKRSIVHNGKLLAVMGVHRSIVYLVICSSKRIVTVWPFFRQAGDEAGIFARMDRAKIITASTESVASGLRLARCPRVKLWPASPALFAYAATLASSAPSKGRATRCTVLGFTSNLVAILRRLMPPEPP
jgi:hypothetical protein